MWRKNEKEIMTIHHSSFINKRTMQYTSRNGLYFDLWPDWPHVILKYKKYYIFTMQKDIYEISKKLDGAVITKFDMKFQEKNSCQNSVISTPPSDFSEIS